MVLMGRSGLVGHCRLEVQLVLADRLGQTGHSALKALKVLKALMVPALRCHLPVQPGPVGLMGR